MPADHHQMPDVAGPLREGWVLTPGSRRRTQTLAAMPEDSWLGGYRLEGYAADHSAAQSQRGGIVRSVALLGSIAPDGNVRSLQLELDGATLDLSERMAGVSVISGFRRELAARVPEFATASIEGCLLDDIVGSRFLASFGLLVSHPTEEIKRDKTPPLDTCSGWRTGGHAALNGPLGETGTPNLLAAPSVRSLFGSEWPPESELPEGAMVRRRLLDASAGDPIRVRSWFRDSIVRGSDEGSLHEYELTAEVSEGRIASVDAIARSLPHLDCPVAAAHTGVLIDRDVDNLDPTIRAHLHSVLGCTHLNDALRYLRIAPVL